MVGIIKSIRLMRNSPFSGKVRGTFGVSLGVNYGCWVALVVHSRQLSGLSTLLSIHFHNSDENYSVVFLLLLSSTFSTLN